MEYLADVTYILRFFSESGFVVCSSYLHKFNHLES